MCRVNGTLKVAIGSCSITPVLLPDFDTEKTNSKIIIDTAMEKIFRAGGLEEYKDKYTSLELPKKALEWRGD